MNRFSKIHTVLYVEDQEKSRVFYERVFRTKASLHVPGMTEFELTTDFILGLMPNSGIAKILEDKTPHPATGTGIPRCEIYLYVDDAESEYQNATDLNVEIISPLLTRNWGDRAFYFSDPDGHIIVFATKIKNHE
jgi:uncharacterized glyoxalase superfamily protein PhnB